MADLDDYGPYDGQSKAEDFWRDFFRHLTGSGVIDGVGSEFAVTERGAGANMSVDVAAGECFVRGQWGESTSTKNLPISSADPTNPRIDRVVLRNHFGNNKITLEVLEGTPAGSPAAPALTQSAAMWEISLAQISVPAADTSIANAQITDQRTIISHPLVDAAAAPSDGDGLVYNSTTGLWDATSVAGTVNVLDHGALGDGATDDTAAFAAAVTAATAGDTILIPAGHNFVVTDTTTVAKRLRFTGGGTLTITTASRSIFVVTADGCEFDGLRFVGTATTGHEGSMPNSYGSAVVFKQVTGGIFRDCHVTSCPGVTPSGSGFTDTGAAVWLTSSNDCQIIGNTFVDCLMAVNTDVFYGLPTGTGGHVITGNIMRGGDRGYVLDLAGTDTDIAGDVFADNRLSGMTNRAIDVIDADYGFALRGNTITACALGITLSRRCRRGQIVGNLIHYCTAAGLTINQITTGEESYDCAITGNVISDNDGHGIHIYGGYRLTFVGNVVRRNGGGGITTVAGGFPQGIKVVGNIIYANQTHGMFLASPADWHIASNEINLNGQAASGTYDGIHIDSASTEPRRVVMVGNSFDSEVTETQRYAINNTHASGSHLYAIGNTTTGQVTGEIADTSAAMQKMMNGGTANSIGSALTITGALTASGRLTGAGFTSTASESHFGKGLTGNPITVQDSGGSAKYSFSNQIGSTGLLRVWDEAVQQTTVGAAGAASALPGAPKGYLRFTAADGVACVIPFYPAV